MQIQKAAEIVKMPYSRKLSPKFIVDLKSGVLAPLLNRIKEDQTLLLAIREDYINIYYRGGNLLKVYPTNDSTSYIAEFDMNYNKKGAPLAISFPYSMNNPEKIVRLVDVIPELKYRMDVYFTRSRKSEREFQQLVVRENNYSTIAGQTHYFIVDIEIAGLFPGARYDMLAVRWLSHERRLSGTLVPALIEMKYGPDALDGLAGMKKHMDDAYALREKEPEWGQVLSGLEDQLNQLDELGLLTFKRSAKVDRLRIDKATTPELIFLLAGQNPGSTKLQKILNEIDINDVNHRKFDLLFFVSSFAGYGMYRESMLNLEQFRIEVSKLLKIAGSIRRAKGADPTDAAAGSAASNQPSAVNAPNFRSDLTQ